MPLRSRSLALAALATLALGASACERGCLSSWSGSPGASGHQDGSFDLSGTDCSDGLARCVDGRVEISIAKHVPHPCASPRERSGTCECPWEVVGQCASGCVKDALEVVATTDVARVQLCNPAEPVLRAVTPTEALGASICAGESVSCAHELVRTCPAQGQPERLVAGCAAGCAAGIGVEPGDFLTGDGVAAILCRRAHAERR